MGIHIQAKEGPHVVEVKRIAVAFHKETGELIKFGTYDDVKYFYESARHAYVEAGYANHIDEIVWMELHTEEKTINPDAYRDPDFLLGLYALHEKSEAVTT